MTLALWKLTIRQSRGLFLALAAVMFGFQWMFVWMTAQLDFAKLTDFLNSMQDFWKRILPVEVQQMLTLSGRLAIGYEHPLITFGCMAWAITRGSDVVSGMLGRGNLEMILAQPVRRMTWMTVHSLVTIVGAAVLAVCCWLGTYCGLRTVPLFHETPALPFVWVALNLFAMTYFLIGVTTLLSAVDRYRWRTIGLVSAYFVVSVVLKVVGRAAPDLYLLQYLSYLTLFEPQKFIALGAEGATVSLLYNSGLVLLGTLALGAAGLAFARRDLPAPH